MYWITGLLGIISAIAPFLLGYNSNPYALWTSLTIGAVLVLSAAFEAFAKDEQRWEYWVAGIVGVGALVAPFLLGFNHSTSALLTSLGVGIVAVLIAGVKLTSGGTRYG